MIAGVYAWCRTTDDMVDSRPDLSEEERGILLDAWVAVSRAAYDGIPAPATFVNEVMADMRENDAPFRYAELIAEGVRMDLEHREYQDMESIREYSYRVASAVGLWITELAGIRDAWTLERAAALGHAMQLTNILRDVGEDLAEGRLYLPLDHLNHYGLSREILLEQLNGEGIPAAYPELMESLMAEADRQYDLACEAIPKLPPSYQRPIAVAARIYQGIHRSLRRNNYDNLHYRAHTRKCEKISLAAGALLELGRIKRRYKKNRH